MSTGKIQRNNTTNVNALFDGPSYAESCKTHREGANVLLEHSDTQVLVGFNVHLSIQNDALVIRQGSVNGNEQVETKYYRGTSDLKHLVILSSSGNIALSALHWCKEQDVSLVLLDGDGSLLYSLTPEPPAYVSLRRVQYKLSECKQGQRIAIELVRQKISEQLVTLQHHPELPLVDTATDTIKIALRHFQPKPTNWLYDVARLRALEGNVAASYFEAFLGTPIKWQSKDAKIVPPHWLTICERESPLAPNKNARHAVNPFHAALNYLYSVTEHQLLRAVNINGLDPACGVLHADKPNRSSLVFDLIEPLRAKVDDKLLSLFVRTTWKRGDITPKRDGGLQFNPEVARHLVASCSLPQKEADMVVSRFKLALTKE